MRSRQITVDAEVWIDEVLDEIDLDELIEYVEDKGYKVYGEYAPIPSSSRDMLGEFFPPLKRIGYTKDDLYRHLCDIVEVGYCTPKDQVIEKLRTLF